MYYHASFPSACVTGRELALDEHALRRLFAHAAPDITRLSASRLGLPSTSTVNKLPLDRVDRCVSLSDPAPHEDQNPPERS